MIASISPATLKQYNGTYKLWWVFCSKNNISKFNASALQVISFLNSLLLAEEVNYGSLNTHRSALSLILTEDIGKDPLLKRFIKGVFRLRPPKPRYDTTWDPKVLLDYLKNWPDPLDLRRTSLKLVTMLALVTGGRLQTISLIRLSSIVENNTELKIFIPDPIKTTAPNRTQPCLQIPFFKEDPKLCVAATLKDYIKKTQPIRQPNQDFLFLTTKAPHKTASKQTISKWVKKLLGMAGIDTDYYKPHSTRHAASSAALRQGLSIQAIYKSAGWSETSSVFAKFYNRPLHSKTDFAKSIISLVK